MLFDLCPAVLSDHATDLLVVALHTDEAPAIDIPAYAQCVQNGDFTGKAGTQLMIPAPAGLSAQRLLLVGLG